MNNFPIFNDNYILSLVNKRITYDKGIRYYREKSVLRLDYNETKTNFKAGVSGSGGSTYKVALEFNKGELQKYNCTCPFSNSYDGICKHVIAVMKTIQSFGKEERVEPSSSNLHPYTESYNKVEVNKPVKANSTIVICGDCKNEFSISNTFCPNCGCPTRFSLPKVGSIKVESHDNLKKEHFQDEDFVALAVGDDSTVLTSVQIDDMCKLASQKKFVIDRERLVLCRTQDEVVVVPYGIKQLSEKSFENCKCKVVFLPSTVEKLDDNCFNNSFLETIIGHGVVIIGEKCFYNCDSLKQTIFTSKLQWVGKAAFSGSGLVEYNIGINVKFLGDDLFQNCKFLKKLVIKADIKELPNGLCSKCISLKSIILPQNLISIGNDEGSSFMNCSVFYDCASLTHINIPKSVERIEGFAFTGCKKLQKIKLGTKIEYVGNMVFWGCDNLVIYLNHAPEEIAEWNEQWNKDNRPIINEYNNNTIEEELRKPNSTERELMDEKEHPLIGPIYNAPFGLIIAMIVICITMFVSSVICRSTFNSIIFLFSSIFFSIIMFLKIKK